MTRDRHTKLALDPLGEGYTDDETVLLDAEWLDEDRTLEYTVPPELMAAISMTVDEGPGTIVRPVPPPPIQHWRKP